MRRTIEQLAAWLLETSSPRRGWDDPLTAELSQASFEPRIGEIAVSELRVLAGEYHEAQKRLVRVLVAAPGGFRALEPTTGGPN